MTTPEFNVTDVERISGTEFAGDPYQVIGTLAKVFRNTHIDADSLKNLDSFEQVMIGTFLQKFHLMREKQKKYGKLNISKGGLFGLITRLNDKVERLKNLVGDPVALLDEARRISAELQEAETDDQAIALANELEAALNPGNDTDESVEDTAIDAGNYGDIMFMVLFDAWGKDMEQD